MQKMVFDLVGGLPTPEMTRAYEAQQSVTSWREELQRHLDETAPPVQQVRPLSVPFDDSDRFPAELMNQIMNEIFGGNAGNISIRMVAFDENGEPFEMN